MTLTVWYAPHVVPTAVPRWVKAPKVIDGTFVTTQLTLVVGSGRKMHGRRAEYFELLHVCRSTDTVHLSLKKYALDPERIV